jgi:hypothetical protein
VKFVRAARAERLGDVRRSSAGSFLEGWGT